MFEMVQAGGWLMLPILLCSVVALAIVGERFWSLQEKRIAPANLVACALWATIVGTLGYVFSGWVSQIVTTMDTLSGRAPAVIAGFVAFVVLLVVLRRAVLRYWRSRETL